jgi:HPt (histidine-containing phosphotransfer) domain-containing protein
MRQLGLNESTVDMIIENFFLTIEDDLQRLQDSLEGKDLNKIKSAAHYIKSSCSNLAMNEAAKELGEIEENARRGEVKGDVSKIKSIFENIKKGLEQ